jgi:branched-chain amino acid transport system substrate-binding protein
MSMTKSIVSVTLIAVLISGAIGAIQDKSTPCARPYRDFREQAGQYAGPGRENAEPSDVAEVLIGYFGPDDANHPDGGDLWRAAELAVTQANKGGGYKGKPFRLVAAWSDNPWSAGVAKLARSVYKDRVWAIIGGIDGTTAHLAEQVVAKARLPLVCPASSDRTANVANVPWMFSVLPGDDMQCLSLATALAGRGGARTYSFISAQDHDSRLFLAALTRSLKKYGSVPCYTHVIPADDSDERVFVRQILTETTGDLVVAADVSGSVRLVRALRSAGFRGRIWGTQAMGRRRFLLAAGPAAEGVLFPLLYDRDGLPSSFQSEFGHRYHISPDFAAAHTFDSVSLLIAAIGRAGLNRAKIGDEIRKLSPYAGVTGRIAWDRLGSNHREVGLGTIHSGKLVRAETTNASSPIKAR